MDPEKDQIGLGDVVEIISSSQRWAVGCLLIVDGIYPSGVSGYIPKPFLAHTGPTRVYCRVSWSELHYVGPRHKKKVENI